MLVIKCITTTVWRISTFNVLCPFWVRSYFGWQNSSHSFFVIDLNCSLFLLLLAAVLLLRLGGFFLLVVVAETPSTSTTSSSPSSRLPVVLSVGLIGVDVLPVAATSTSSSWATPTTSQCSVFCLHKRRWAGFWDRRSFWGQWPGYRIWRTWTHLSSSLRP